MTQSSKQSPSTYAHLAESDAGLVQGFSAARLATIADVMQEQVQANHFPGAVTMVARQGEVVHYAAHGFQDAAKSKRMSKDSIFRLASMTKPLVTAAAMILVERGRMNMFDPIVKWLPELKDIPAKDLHKWYDPSIHNKWLKSGIKYYKPMFNVEELKKQKEKSLKIYKKIYN